MNSTRAIARYKCGNPACKKYNQQEIQWCNDHVYQRVSCQHCSKTNYLCGNCHEKSYATLSKILKHYTGHCMKSHPCPPWHLNNVNSVLCNCGTIMPSTPMIVNRDIETFRCEDCQSITYRCHLCKSTTNQVYSKIERHKYTCPNRKRDTKKEVVDQSSSEMHVEHDHDTVFDNNDNEDIVETENEHKESDNEHGENKQMNDAMPFDETNITILPDSPQQLSKRVKCENDVVRTLSNNITLHLM